MYDVFREGAIKSLFVGIEKRSATRNKSACAGQNLNPKNTSTSSSILDHVGQDCIYEVVATGHILGEGADISVLDCLFLVFPIAFEGKLIQYIGRIQRGDTGTRTVFDYRDEKVEMLDKMFKKRQRYYKKLNRA